jgi:hypothetical protein
MDPLTLYEYLELFQFIFDPKGCPKNNTVHDLAQTIIYSCNATLSVYVFY